MTITRFGKPLFASMHDGYCPTESLNWQRRPARLAAGALSLRMHELCKAWSQDVTRLRMAFPKENDSNGHN